ncbi:hypothetical protein, partial [Coleofasciculus sp.]|uniref:hypothetical protein n=1 Tax=Coleofasciculus sp. TaxID=3100458 RepID=UPI003A29B8CD
SPFRPPFRSPFRSPFRPPSKGGDQMTKNFYRSNQFNLTKEGQHLENLIVSLNLMIASLLKFLRSQSLTFDKNINLLDHMEDNIENPVVHFFSQSWLLLLSFCDDALVLGLSQIGLHIQWLKFISQVILGCTILYWAIKAWKNRHIFGKVTKILTNS